jgi:hypothetical protein
MLVTESCSFPVSGLLRTVRQRASIAAGAGICLGRMTFPLVGRWEGKYNRWLRIGLNSNTHSLETEARLFRATALKNECT